MLLEYKRLIIKVAKLMHQHNGVCFIDFACSGPYVKIDMHPEDSQAYLDAIFFSPHKFLGGPGTSGVLVFNKKLYSNMVPDCPGGGTVSWTNPWGEHKYIDNIEEREDGGTPGFLQAIKIALVIELKNKMGIENILVREHELVDFVFSELGAITNVKILAAQHRERLGVISFFIEDLHFSLGVKLLNDKFGIQSRGGCSCAGTYGHFLLNVDQEASRKLVREISLGDLIRKPGWIRISIHPTTTTAEIALVCNSIKLLAKEHKTWALDYCYNKDTNEFIHKESKASSEDFVKSWFEL
jgi:selenocysteine lyase/cysteine desulfurase